MKNQILCLVLLAIVPVMLAGRRGRCYDTQCPPTWLGYRGHCYKIISRAGLNWYRAKESCNSMGSYLARINDEDENRFMKIQLTALRTRDNYFIGGTDESTEGTFYWESTGHPVEYTDFGKDQPTGKRDDCLAYYNFLFVGYKWIDRLCGIASNYGYICEADADCLDAEALADMELLTLPINESEVNATMTMI